MRNLIASLILVGATMVGCEAQNLRSTLIQVDKNCTTVEKEWVKYFDADPNLSPEQKARRHTFIRSHHALIDEALGREKDEDE